MTQDKQLDTVTLERVTEKGRLGQALNTKEFAVLAGISYSAARGWFRLPGFPVFRGLVFWQDFTDWRRAQFQLNAGEVETAARGSAMTGQPSRINAKDLPPGAARILMEE